MCKDITKTKNASQFFWREAISTIVYTPNWVQLRKRVNKTPYEIWYGRTTNVSYFKVFGSKCYIKNDEWSGNFDTRSEEGVFLSYWTKRKAYKCQNLKKNKMIDSENVKVDKFSEYNEEHNIIKPEEYNELIYFEPEKVGTKKINTGNNNTPSITPQ